MAPFTAAVVVSGDLTVRASPEGFDAFIELLAERADVLPEDRANIVVVPGNHDVDWGAGASTRERYAGFLGATRDHGCTTPLLDGIDFNPSGSLALKPGTETQPHVVDHPEFLIIPLNSSNYCGTVPAIRGAWSENIWEDRLAPLGDELPEALRQIEALRKLDIARISRQQVRSLRLLFESLSLSATRGQDPRPRIAVLHHQLLPVSTREEWKPFESLLNLGFVRQTLREFGCDIVLHGHKHVGALYWDFAARGVDTVTSPLRRILVVASPGHFRPNEPVFRAIALIGSPRARNLKITTFRGVEAFASTPQTEAPVVLPAWLGQMESESSRQPLIRGKTAHETYARLCAYFELSDATRLENLACETDGPLDAEVLPPDYPDVGQTDAQKWFSELVSWWQLPNSRLVREEIILFNHGDRLRERWGDQIDRVIRVLNEQDDSSRGLAILIAPNETGRYEDDQRPLDRGTFPAFALAEFGLTRREGHTELDCFGYFRKQEMKYWWPVNVAELALLQAEVHAGLKPKYRARVGRIVTFSAIALYGTELPQVAVTEIDRAVESKDRLWQLATSIAFPAVEDVAAGVADWELILAELAGHGRLVPPVPGLGDEALLAELVRLAPFTQNRGPLDGVLSRLDELCKIYDTMRTREIGQPEAALIVPAVERLQKAVDLALGGVSP